MPITSLYCVKCGGERPLDHYTAGACPRPPMPLPWIFGIQKHVLEDDRHPPMQMSATRLVECQRARAIQDLLPVPKVDLRRFNQAAFGWAGHAWMQANTPPSMLAEVEVKGTLFRGSPYEIPVTGHIDVLRPDPSSGRRLVRLEDYKFTSDANQRYVTKVTEKVEWNVQGSIYSLLASFPIDGAAIWSGAPSPARSSAEPWMEIPIRILTEERILDAVPYEGASSVADHILDFKALQERLAQGMPPEEAVGLMPLRGEQQWRRGEKSKCDYCVMSEVCGRLVRGAEGGI